MPLLVTTCVIVAAKLEQPMTPSINRMIKLLAKEEQEYVDKTQVILLEQKMLNDLSFDFNYPSPLPFLERYLRICGLQNDQAITARSEEYIKITARQIAFLDFKPSLLAAAALVLAHSVNRNSISSFSIKNGC